jgi:hypothetical protein
MTEQFRLDAKAAAIIAKNPATTAEQLVSVAGISAAIDRLLHVQITSQQSIH